MYQYTCTCIKIRKLTVRMIQRNSVINDKFYHMHCVVRPIWAIESEPIVVRTNELCTYKKPSTICTRFFKKNCMLLILTCTIVPGIDYFVVMTHPFHPIQVQKRCSSSCYMI